MAILLAKVPHDIARLFSEVAVPGDKESEGDMHITLIYFEEMTIPMYFKAAEVIHKVTSTTGPMDVRTSRVSSFPPSPEGLHPVVAHIDSDDLRRLRARVANALDEAGIPYSKKHPTFKPHVTLSYSPTAQEEKPVRSLLWGVGEVSFWGGSWGDHVVSTCFPFVYRPTEEEIYREALRSVALKQPPASPQPSSPLLPQPVVPVSPSGR